MDLIKPVPTRTFVLDVGRACMINCRFCYYHHLGDLRKQTFKNPNGLKEEIDRGIGRGNNYMDVTGGEPCAYPYITHMIKYALDKGVRTCLITNALIGETKLKTIIDSGIDEFLVSVHALEENHDYLTQLKGARQRQIRFLTELKKHSHVKLRFNVVITQFNQNDLFELSNFMAQCNPHIVNFINMNLHHGWKSDTITAKDLIADLRVVEPQLNLSIEFLESKGIGVNVRYYPMCRISPEYRRCIANDLHVWYDPYEWDYHLQKKWQHGRDYWINESKNVEEKNEPCCRCDLQWVCGGANKYFHATSNAMYGEVLIPQKIPEIKNHNDFYFYRQYNLLTLGER